MTVMRRETPGSKYRVHRPWQLRLVNDHDLSWKADTYNQMTRPAVMTPTLPRLQRCVSKLWPVTRLTIVDKGEDSRIAHDMQEYPAHIHIPMVMPVSS